MLSVFCSPSRYTQGKNATASLGKEMTALGLRGPVLILAGRSAIRLLTETWNRTFSEAGMTHAVYHNPRSAAASASTDGVFIPSSVSQQTGVQTGEVLSAHPLHFSLASGILLPDTMRAMGSE
jgi:hypothetical protein